MKNKRGFTLVELLVAIVIMGIITAISIPMIRNIREGNEDKQYNVYSDSLKQSAKLYLDSYEEDLFGREESGCAIVTYEKLKEKELIKDISMEDTTCAVADTFVKIVKLDGKYGYSTSLVCGEKKSDGTFKETVRIPKEGLSNSDVCSVGSDMIMSITAQPSSSTSINYKKRNIVLTVKSDTGVDINSSLSYGFSLDQSTNVVDGWGVVDLTVPGREQQKNDILNGHIIEIDSSKIFTPEAVSGDYYLVVRVDKLLDIAGKSWKKEEDAAGEESILYFGPYTVDNTPPEFNNSTIIVDSTGYPQLSLNASDNMSSESDMKMCVSYDSDTCSKKTKNIKNNYSHYSKNKVLSDIATTLNGTNHTVYVTVADAAGNYSTTSYEVELPFAITYYANDDSNKTMTQFCAKNTYCTLNDYFTKDYNTVTEWNTSADGSGSSYTSGNSIQLTEPLELYAQWRKNNIIIRYLVTGTDRAVYFPKNQVITGGIGYFDAKNLYDSTSLSANGLGDYHVNDSERRTFYYSKSGGYAASTVWVYDSAVQKDYGTPTVEGTAGTTEISVATPFEKRMDLLDAIASEDKPTLKSALKKGDITLCLKPKMMECTWLVSNPYSCYNTLSEAVSAANAGATLTLLKSSQESVNTSVNKDLKIDFGGNTYSLLTTTNSEGKNVYHRITISESHRVEFVGSGTLSGTGKVLQINHGSTAVMNGDVVNGTQGLVINGCSVSHACNHDWCTCGAVHVFGRLVLNTGYINSNHGAAVWVGHGGMPAKHPDQPENVDDETDLYGTFYMTGGVLSANKDTSDEDDLGFMSTIEVASSEYYDYTIDGQNKRYTVYVTGGEVIRKLTLSNQNCCIKIRKGKFCKAGGTFTNTWNNNHPNDKRTYCANSSSNCS